MGDGYAVAKEGGRTVYASADGLFRVRATGVGPGGPAWCVEHAGQRRYAFSLKDARGVIARWQAELQTAAAV